MKGCWLYHYNLCHFLPYLGACQTTQTNSEKMNLRDWLIIIGVVIILGIVLDGIRRMRLAKKDSLKMSLEMGGNLENTPIDDDFNPELPAGGARIIQKNALDSGVMDINPDPLKPSSLPLKTDKFKHKPIVANEQDAGNVSSTSF